MNYESEIAKALLKTEAVKISTNPAFTWTSGMKSPIYCDNRLLISFPDQRKLIIEGFKNIIKKQQLEFDVIAGTATAAIPWAAFLAADMDLPMTYVRPKPKGHGAGKQVEGTMAQGSRVLIVEDLFSTGGSSITSAAACQREYEAEVIAAIAIFSYEFPFCAQNFEEAQLPHFTLSNLKALLGEIDILDKEKQLVLDFSADPKAWESKHER